MNTLAAVVVAAVLVAGSGCSSHAEQSEAKTTSTDPSTPQQAALPVTTPRTSYGVRCITVSADMARRIVSGEEKGVGMVPGMAVAVKSPDLKDSYFVAMQFKVSGVAETQMGVWSVTTSVKVGTHERIMAVDGSARRFTEWPPARYPSADIRRRVNFTVGDAAACLLK